jgi:hypothetical protein
MTTATKSKVTIAQAKQELQAIRQNLLDAGEAIALFIEHRSYEVLGYETFAACWDAELAEIKWVADIKPQVVYAMLDEGLSDEEITSSVKGVRPAKLAALKSQKKHGVPASKTAVPKGRRGRIAGVHNKGYVHVAVGWERLQEWRKIAKDWDTTVEDVMLAQAEAWFDTP